MWECYCSPCTVWMWLCHSTCFFMYSICTHLSAQICLHISLGILWWIHLLSLIILCFADGMCKPPPCLCVSFFLSPYIGRPGNRWSSFEPITQPDPLIITNLPESLIWGLPNCALCTMWLSFLSCCVFFFFLGGWCEGGKSKEKEREREGEGDG